MNENLKTMHTKAQWTNLDSEQVLRVEKSGKIDRFDENTMVLIEEDQPFHNGMIEVKMRSRLLPGAPDFARGFIGIVFRAKPDGCRRGGHISFYGYPRHWPAPSADDRGRWQK